MTTQTKCQVCGKTDRHFIMHFTNRGSKLMCRSCAKVPASKCKQCKSVKCKCYPHQQELF